MMKRYLRTAALAPLLATLATGCVTRPEPLYYWGDYQGQVYGYLNSDKTPEAQILALEADMEKARSRGKSVPPGYHAHLGMLYGKTGRTDDMIAHFDQEKALFPESAPFMDFLMRNYKR